MTTSSGSIVDIVEAPKSGVMVVGESSREVVGWGVISVDCDCNGVIE